MSTRRPLEDLPLSIDGHVTVNRLYSRIVYQGEVNGCQYSNSFQLCHIEQITLYTECHCQ